MDYYQYQEGPKPEPRPLTHFTFWAGAGFSKSWDEDAPVGKQLFTLDARNLQGIADPMVLSRLFGMNGEHIEDDDLRQIVYQLDMYERYSDMCSRYIDPQNINIIRAGLRAAVVRRYDTLARLNYFDPEAEKFPLASLNSQQRSILNFFGHIHRRGADASEDFIEGIRCHFVTTNYDYVIETILDNILGADDSVFLYAYRGFTPSGISKPTIPVLTHQHWLSQHLIKLNGGFEILREGDRYCLDYSSRSPRQIIDKPPIIMLPSREL
jgi:hypothetical protein